jgi:hypothetical protein
MGSRCFHVQTNSRLERLKVENFILEVSFFKHELLKTGVLPMDFVVCTLAVKKKKSGQVSTCRIGPFPCKTYGEMYVYIHICLTSALIGGEWSALPPGKEPPLPIG